MLERHETYYRIEGILATTFTCPLKRECRDTNETFNGPKSAASRTDSTSHAISVSFRARGILRHDEVQNEVCNSFVI